MAYEQISVIILAAGVSSRMGQPKLIMPWGQGTVLAQVVGTFAQAGIVDIVVVTGGAREQVEDALADLSGRVPVRPVYNPNFADNGMLSSIKTGLVAQNSRTRAVLIGLGDQPQVRAGTVEHICAAYLRSGSHLVIPSFNNQRGHPWLVDRILWEEILALPADATPRQFIQAHAGGVEYVPGDRSILQDLDTPQEYARQRPGG